MGFEEYDPKSTLVVPSTTVGKAKFPFIDIHSHQWDMPTQDLAVLVEEMDKLNMALMCNLSGGSGEHLKQSVLNIKNNFPDRFIVFANLDFTDFGKKSWTKNAVKQLEEDVQNGAKGLKIFENLGTRVKDSNGKRVPVNDVRLDLIWEKCAELQIPVLIHTAAPIAFWDPFDKTNERWLELAIHPDRRRSDAEPAPFYTLIEEQHAAFRKHPDTKFIAAHFNWHANNLDLLAEYLDSIPNMVVEFGAVIAELGRQPRAAHEFFVNYQDRILFGKDSWKPEEYSTYFRVLETTDEYFPYHKKYHAFWRLYGIGLPDEVLEKIYYKNALKLINGIEQSTLFDEK